MKSIGARLLVLLGLLPGLLAACGDSAPPPTAVPAAPTATAPTSPAVAGEFVGVANSVDFIGLSTNGQQIIAYICDGTATHPVTFAVWFSGPLTNNLVNLTAKNGAQLVATMTPQAASGTVTLSSGQSFSFTANAVTAGSGPFSAVAGVYRSDQTIGGVRYLAGWVALPGDSAGGTAALISYAYAEPWPPLQGGGILVGTAGTLLAAPPLTEAEVPAGNVEGPNVGTFPLHLCRQGACP